MTFFHAAISVKNLEESRTFYEEVFDLKFRAAGERPELGVKFVILQDKNGAGVELFEHATPVPTTEDFMDFSNVGFKHIAFIVDDLEATFDKALKAGAKVIWPIKKGVTVKRLAFIADPNNIPIELVEPK
ncbi:MAG: VOC family protein [Candidatus Levybacteria bacterium]|nr:VOC family protein [Candidatus Levybacteria bacterium]